MRIVFMGTSAFAVPVLQALCAAGHSIVKTVTQPDRPSRRGLRLTPSPVKEAAIRLGLSDIYQPEKLRADAKLRPLLETAADCIVTVAYGQLLPVELLEHPLVAAVNVHASLLPRHRGAAPLQRALMAGDTIGGVTVMHMSAQMDAGDIIAQHTIAIDSDLNYGTLHDRLAEQGAELLCAILPELKAGRATRHPQDPSLVTYAPRIMAADQRIDWSKDATHLHNLVRALDPLPGAETLYNDTLLKIWRARAVMAAQSAVPGTLLQRTAEGPLVATGSGALLLLEVQPAGKRRMPAEDWLRGIRNSQGLRLE